MLDVCWFPLLSVSVQSLSHKRLVQRKKPTAPILLHDSLVAENRHKIPSLTLSDKYTMQAFARKMIPRSTSPEAWPVVESLEKKLSRNIDGDACHVKECTAKSQEIGLG